MKVHTSQVVPACSRIMMTALPLEVEDSNEVDYEAKAGDWQEPSGSVDCLGFQHSMQALAENVE